jgi:hypothetical protein
MFFRRKTAFVLSESRVRENRLHGSEGGAVNARPYPYQGPRKVSTPIGLG